MFGDNAAPGVVAGLASIDDAAAFRVAKGRLSVFTLDFFPPVVDDAGDYGAIAAANSMSDVWAMGADPVMALNIALLPPDMPPSIREKILIEAGKQVKKAGAVIAGGHTMDNKEPIFGLAVFGLGREDELMSKTSLVPGSMIILTKPLGSGVITTAAKKDMAPPSSIKSAVFYMRQLNMDASRIARKHKVTCATDVTGFGMLGHCLDMCSNRPLGMEIWLPAIDFIQGSLDLAEKWLFPGGAVSNRSAYSKMVEIDPSINPNESMLLFDPQTSGGLLLQVEPSRVDSMLSDLEVKGYRASCIGRVVERDDPVKIHVSNSRP